MNLLYFVLLMVVNFLLITVSYKMFGRKGVLGYIVLSVIAANIQVSKGVVFDFGLFELESTLGNVMFGGVFLATDLLSEKYGLKVASNAVKISIFANLSFVLVMFLSTLFQGVDWSGDFNGALALFFDINGGALKAVLVGNLVYFISQSIDVRIYAKLKERFSSHNQLWIRNNGSTIVSQTVDAILITLGFAIVGIFPWFIVIDVFLVTMIIKVIIALVDTPFLYLMSYITPRGDSDVE